MSSLDVLSKSFGSGIILEVETWLWIKSRIAGPVLKNSPGFLFVTNFDGLPPNKAFSNSAISFVVRSFDKGVFVWAPGRFSKEAPRDIAYCPLRASGLRAKPKLTALTDDFDNDPLSISLCP